MTTTTTTMQDSKFGEHLYLSPRVPQGLAAAVEGLTREVIRHRPDNIYAFAARHFENLLRLREQYGEASTSSKKDPKLLHEVNEAVTERCDESKVADDHGVRQSGWSLNETAKVLEKHRSIFGDSGQKVSTEQIRELANEPLLCTSREQRKQDGNPKRKADEDNAGSSRRKECLCAAQESSKNGLRNAPRILSQIPIAKDIKTELRKNRISSRESKKVVACEYTRETIVEKSSKRSFEKTKKSYEVRSERKSCRTEDSSTKKRSETMKSSRTNSREDNKLTRAASMDSVKNYVLQNFVSMTSLDELQSPSYVEKVQEVIDETSSIIKEKVEALKTGVARAAKAKQMRKQVSVSSEDRSKSSSKSDSERKNQEPSLSRRNSKIAHDTSLDPDVSEASESKSCLPAVRPASSKSTSRSVSARSDSDGALTLPPISPETAKSPKVEEELVLPVLSPPRTAPSLEDATRADDTTATVEQIAEDLTGNIVEDKVVPSDEKVAENLMPLDIKEKIDEQKTETVIAEQIVPSEKELVSPEEINDEKAVTSEEICHEKMIVSEQSNEDKPLPAPVISNEEIEESVIAKEKAATGLLQVQEEEFHDSLNVTPEPFDTTGQRPDSLETSLAEDNKSAASSGHVSPLETLKDKLLEIEQVQKRIEDVLDDNTKTCRAEEQFVGKTNEAITASKIEDTLIVIQEAEKRIEQILDSQSTAETLNSDIKNKLQELEEAERRIENIFNNEAIKEKDAPVNDIEECAVTSENDDGSKAENEEKQAAATNDNLSVRTIVKENSEKIEEPRAVSPHSYILTEGSPYEIPDSVTIVIIPERTATPDSESLQVEVEDVDILTSKETEIDGNQCNSTDEAFGESVKSSEHTETSTVDIDYIRGIKASHDMIVSRENLDRIKEERDEAEVIDSEDEKVLKVVTSSLEEILEREEVEYVEMVKYTDEHKLETIENSIESTARSAESTNEVKETSLATDRSSLSFDPAVPIVPELNLDSLPDLTISSFNISEKDSSSLQSLKKEDSLDAAALSDSETQHFEKLEERLNEPTAASDIGLPVVDINNVVCSSVKVSHEENKLVDSQCTVLIDVNRRESMADHDDDDNHADDKKTYHIYVPEASSSKDVSSSSETSTFISAATKIQAGVRGFLTRRRLQSTQKRSSTLDSVPSIQESFAVETIVALMPIVETTGMPEAKARKKLRREDAVQRTTLSVENAFAENQLQHSGEFHDCIPLPVFDAVALSMKSMKQRQSEKAKEKASQVEQLLEKILLGQAASNLAALHPKLVDVVLLPGDTDLQSKYLNFITSVEDVFSDIPETPKGVIIEEITSLDEASKSGSEELKMKDDKPNDADKTLASISTSEDPLSINIEQVLGLGEEDQTPRESNRLNVKLNTVDQLRSSSDSQDSPVGDERTRSPVTMMQIAPKSVDEKSEEIST